MTCSAAAMIERLTSRKHPETLSTGARKSESFLGNLGQMGQGGSALGVGVRGGRGGGECHQVYLAPTGRAESPCAFTGRQGLDHILDCWLPHVEGIAGPDKVELSPQQQLPGAQQGGHQPPAGGIHILQHPLSTVHIPLEATAQAEPTVALTLP